jgi:hypothetical protein
MKVLLPALAAAVVGALALVSAAGAPPSAAQAPAPMPTPSPITTPGAAPSRWVVGPAADASASPVLAAAIQQFTTMTATHYQHTYSENAAQGVYFYDCVGFVTYTLGLAAPNARRAIIADLGIRPGYVPSPPAYVHFFTTIVTEPVPSWQAVTRVADIQPGDIIAWNYEANNPQAQVNGHAVIAAGPPLPLADGSFALLVYDSTATPHGPTDTRRTDPRNETGPNGLPSGLGRGTLQLIPDPTTGAPAAFAWSFGTACFTPPIAIGRALN